MIFTASKLPSHHQDHKRPEIQAISCTALFSVFFIRILFFQPRLNILIFVPTLGWKYSSQYSYITGYEISVFEGTQCLDGVRVILEPAWRCKSTIEQCCAVFVPFWLVWHLGEGPGGMPPLHYLGWKKKEKEKSKKENSKAGRASKQASKKTPPPSPLTCPVFGYWRIFKLSIYYICLRTHFVPSLFAIPVRVWWQVMRLL